MNAKIKDAIRDWAFTIQSAIKGLGGTLASCLRMLILSSPAAAIKTKKIKELKSGNCCTILANGPSLKAAMENGEVITKNSDLMCVNMFCNSEYFWQLKPRFYFLVDGQFFNPTLERCMGQVEQLKEAFAKVDWDMYLVISTSSGNGGVLESLCNPRIKILKLNTTDVNGYQWFRHLMYNMRMGMPRCQTITNMALTTAIIMGYKDVYLYGADHTWTRDLCVDDDNVCCYGDRHVYNTNLQVIKLKYDIATLLRQYADMFESHHIINKYAKSVGCHIWNCTKGTFVDAYDRYQS